MKIGYARVSSNSQDIELQKQELLNAGCKRIFSESVSGVNFGDKWRKIFIIRWRFSSKVHISYSNNQAFPC